MTNGVLTALALVAELRQDLAPVDATARPADPEDLSSRLGRGIRSDTDVSPVTAAPMSAAGTRPVDSAGRISARWADRDPWLISERADFWVASAGGASLLVAMALGLLWLGDRHLHTADLLLSELHLGATYDVVWRRRLWRRMPVDVIVVPVAILVAAYAVVFADHSWLLPTVILYLGAWHRGRQNLGIARYYQRSVGGPMSVWHRRIFCAAIYLPMAATVTYFTSTASDHEGEPFQGLALSSETIGVLGGLAFLSVLVYLASTSGWRDPAVPRGFIDARRATPAVHPAERWLVVANAVAFGSAYVVGAWNASFLLVLVVHHEVQYLYFTYALARRGRADGPPGLGRELRRLGSFAVWPIIGLATWAVCILSGLEWLSPFLAGGLLCHYWLDARIWTARARRLTAA
jgi:hypothetical protein